MNVKTNRNDPGVVQRAQGLKDLAFGTDDRDIDMPPAEPPETMAFHASADNEFVPVLVHSRSRDACRLRFYWQMPLSYDTFHKLVRRCSFFIL